MLLTINWIAVGWWAVIITIVAGLVWASRGDRRYRRKGPDA